MNLLRLKLLSVKDLEKLNTFKPSFPCSFETFMQTITQIFADKNLRKLEEGFDDVKEQLENCSTHANLMNLKTLTNEELYNLSNILYSCSLKGQSANESMGELFKHIKPITEDN